MRITLIDEKKLGNDMLQIVQYMIYYDIFSRETPKLYVFI